MAELMFKRGEQSRLPAVGTDGCFYLTTDTNRLYVGQGEGNAPVLLNQTVQVVNKVADLPKSPPAVDNDFFYCVEENVLAVYHDGEWTQINTNTNDTIKVTDIAFGTATTNADKTSVEYTLTLQQTKYDLWGSELEDENSKISPITAKLVLNTEDIAPIIPEESEVGLALAEQYSEKYPSVKGVSVSTTGSGSNPEKDALFIPGVNVDRIGLNDQGEIEIDTHNTTYNMVVESDASIKLTSSDLDETQIHFVAGTDLVVSAAEKTGPGLDAIKYTHKTYNTAGVGVTNKDTLEPEDTLNIISKIDLSNGHVTKIETAEVKVPFDTHLEPGVSHNSNSWQATFADNRSNEWTIDFSGDASTLETTLKDYIDNGLAAANTALTFKGTINHPDELDDFVDVEVGDVYLLAKNQDLADYSYRVGDLFIAVSKSNQPGVLEKEDLTWTHVPAGDELIIDTRFAGVAQVTGKAGVEDSNNNGSASFHIEAQEDIQGNVNTPENNQTITLIAGHDLEIVNNTVSGSKEEVATIRHVDVSTSTEHRNIDNAFEITAVDGITYDNGHIVNISTKTYSVPTYELSGDDDHIILKDSVDSVCGDIEVTDDNTWIAATVDNNVLKVEHIGPSAATNDITVNNASKLSQEGQLNIISGVHYDAKGHVTSVDTATMTMPDDTTYQFYIGKDADGNVPEEGRDADNPYLFLRDRYDNTYSAQMHADNVNLKITGNTNQVMFNLVWGTF